MERGGSLAFPRVEQEGQHRQCLDRREEIVQPPTFISFYFLGSNPLLTRKTWPSGWRRCISRTFHGISVGGNVISNPAAMQCLCISSRSSTQTDIQTPLSPSSSPSC